MLADLILPVLGLVGSVLVPVVIHRQTHPRRRVSYRVVEVPPLADGRRTVDIAVWSSGRADVPSAAFDSGRPLVFQFASPIVGDIVTDDVDGWGFQRAGADRLTLGPCRVGVDEVYRARVAVEGESGFRLRHPLLDVPVVADDAEPPAHGARPRRLPFRITGLLAGTVLIASGFALFVVGTLLIAGGASMPAWMGALIALLIPAGFITVVVSAAVRLVRHRLQRRRARAEGVVSGG